MRKFVRSSAWAMLGLLAFACISQAQDEEVEAADDELPYKVLDVDEVKKSAIWTYLKGLDATPRQIVAATTEAKAKSKAAEDVRIRKFALNQDTLNGAFQCGRGGKAVRFIKLPDNLKARYVVIATTSPSQGVGISSKKEPRVNAYTLQIDDETKDVTKAWFIPKLTGADYDRDDKIESWVIASGLNEGCFIVLEVPLEKKE